MPTPALVLFDLMDTLLQASGPSRPYWHDLADLVADEGLSSAPAFVAGYERWRATRDRTDPDREVALPARLAAILPGIDAATTARLATRYAEHCARQVVPCDGVVAMLDAWRGRAPLGVVSNFFLAGLPRALLARHGLAARFAFVLDSATTGWRKPDARMYRRALEAGGATGDASRVLMVGDEWRADIAGARAAGLRPLWYSRGEPPEPDVEVLRHWDAFRPPATASDAAS